MPAVRVPQLMRLSDVGCVGVRTGRHQHAAVESAQQSDAARLGFSGDGELDLPDRISFGPVGKAWGRPCFLIQASIFGHGREILASPFRCVEEIFRVRVDIAIPADPGSSMRPHGYASRALRYDNVTALTYPNSSTII